MVDELRTTVRDHVALVKPSGIYSRLGLVIEVVRGNLFDAPVEALVNAVNTVGVMGKGIALAFKRAFPANFEAYKAACERHEVTIGRVFAFHTGTLWILNVPTKRHWRDPSHLDDVRTGIDALAREIETIHVASVAIPALGCGEGGLAWSDVLPLIEAAFAPRRVHAFVFEPI